MKVKIIKKNSTPINFGRGPDRKKRKSRGRGGITNNTIRSVQNQQSSDRKILGSIEKARAGMKDGSKAANFADRKIASLKQGIRDANTSVVQERKNLFQNAAGLTQNQKADYAGARRSVATAGMKGGAEVAEMVASRGMSKKRLKEAGKKLLSKIRSRRAA